MLCHFIRNHLETLSIATVKGTKQKSICKSIWVFMLTVIMIMGKFIYKSFEIRTDI